MRLSEKKENGSGVVHFAEIEKPGVRSSSAWLDHDRHAGRDSSAVVTLRPPRLPSGAAGGVHPAFAIPEREESRDPDADSCPPSDFEPMAEDRQEAARHVEGKDRRRTDTMIDDIVPRAEEEAIVAIRQAVEQAAAERVHQLEASERQLVELALVIARRVIAREVSLDPGIVKGLVREGLRSLGGRDKVVVRMGTFFSEMRADIQRELEDASTPCQVVVDPSLGQCGCRIETELGQVDESIEDRLATLLDGLALEPHRARG